MRWRNRIVYWRLALAALSVVHRQCRKRAPDPRFISVLWRRNGWTWRQRWAHVSADRTLRRLVRDPAVNTARFWSRFYREEGINKLFFVTWRMGYWSPWLMPLGHAIRQTYFADVMLYESPSRWARFFADRLLAAGPCPGIVQVNQREVGTVNAGWWNDRPPSYAPPTDAPWACPWRPAISVAVVLALLLWPESSGDLVLAVPVVTFNAGSGADDYTASGAGPATAVTGTGASLNGTTTLDLSADTPDLSGVAADDLIVFQSSSGIQWGVIVSVNDGADTVVITTAVTPTESGIDWAIGGKRGDVNAALNRLLIESEGETDMEFEFEDNQTISSDLSPGFAMVFRSDGTTQRTITQSANDQHFDMTTAVDIDCRYLACINTNGTKTAAWAYQSSTTGGYNARFKKCTFGHATSTLQSMQNRASGNITFYLIQCEVLETTSDAIASESNQTNQLFGVWLHDAGGDGLSIQAVSFAAWTLFTNNTSEGFVRTTGTGYRMSSLACSYYGNGSDGFTMGSTSPTVLLANNIFVSNGGYGANIVKEPDLNQCNAYYNNTSGARNGFSAGDNDVTLTADPFTAAGSDDYTLNNTSGGGADLKGVGFPLTIP